MTFDPFGDLSEKGYLRNQLGVQSAPEIHALEHHTFMVNLPTTRAWLSAQKSPRYAQLLETHRRLFADLYPWAGQDRLTVLPNRVIHRGATDFAYPIDIQRAFSAGQRSKTPGKKLGYWAFAHPFLECNGRALFLFFSDYLRRSGLCLDWAGLHAPTFLAVLSEQIDQPAANVLDDLLAPHLLHMATA
jgi:cell filamentation protein